MGRVLAGLLAGVLFGSGLVLAGMTNPVKVIAFLDLAGDWDPSLAFVMAGGIAVTMAGYQLSFLRTRPLFASGFSLPTDRELDARLLGGAAIFGVGWGMAGYCPGPALASLALGAPQTMIFVGAMLAGMILARILGAIKPDAPRGAPVSP